MRVRGKQVNFSDKDKYKDKQAGQFILSSTFYAFWKVGGIFQRFVMAWQTAVDIYLFIHHLEFRKKGSEAAGTLTFFKASKIPYLTFIYLFTILDLGKRESHFHWSWKLATPVNFGQQLRWPVLRALAKLGTLFSHQLVYAFWKIVKDKYKDTQARHFILSSTFTLFARLEVFVLRVHGKRVNFSDKYKDKQAGQFVISSTFYDFWKIDCIFQRFVIDCWADNKFLNKLVCLLLKLTCL